MGTISATLPTIGASRGSEEGDVRNALSAIIAEFNGNIDSANMKNAPLVLLSTLTAAGKLIAAGTAFGALELYASAATSGQRRSALSTQAGTTVLDSVSDDGTAMVKRGLSLNHVSGVVDFPNGLSIGGAGAGALADNRGKSIIATTESRSNAAYGKLTTPDQVTVTLATDGLLKVLFQATWQESVGGAARAAIFIGANQLKVAYNNVSPNAPVTEAAVHNGGTVDAPLVTVPIGLASDSAGFAYTGDVATGQAVAHATIGGGLVYELGSATPTTPGAGGSVSPMGGPCYIFATAGTYTVSVQFRSSSGSVTAKNRKLWVSAEAY